MEKEFLFYNILQKQGFETRSKFEMKPLAIPECFYACMDPGVLVLSNLKDLGFDLLKNQIENGMLRGLQDSDLKLYLEALGSFHATMYKVVEDNGGVKAMSTKFPTLGKVV